MLIPDDAKPHEIGIYIVYSLGVKDPKEIQRLFHYRHRSSVSRVLTKIRKRMTMDNVAHAQQ